MRCRPFVPAAPARCPVAGTTSAFSGPRTRAAASRAAAPAAETVAHAHDDDDYHAEVAHRSPSVTSIGRHAKHIGNDGDDDSHAEVTIGARGVTSIGHRVKHTGNEAATTFTQRLQTEARAGHHVKHIGNDDDDDSRAWVTQQVREVLPA